MNNPITYAIDQALLKIPEPIIRRAFFDNMSFGRAIPISAAARIREEVIERRVIVDCNLVGGLQTSIPLECVPPQRVDAYNVVYRIPKDLTQGRSITRAMSIVYGPGQVYGMAHQITGSGNALIDQAAGVLAAQAPIPDVSSAEVSLIGENTILIRNNYSLPANIWLRCWLEHDENMNHLAPTAYKVFAELCLWAIKSYIYNKLIVDLDSGALRAGRELGVIRDIISEYADAEENYETVFSEKWRKVSILNDAESRKRHVKKIVGGGW